MWIVAFFVVGYSAIVLEHPLRLNKAASALLTGGLCWTAYMVGNDPAHVNDELIHHLGQLSQILFFLLGAMAIVELIDAHDGFDLITSRIRTRSRRKLLAIVTVLAFLLSAVLDNLTTSIVMMSLVRKLVPEEVDRRYYAGVVIIAANSGGAWSPIGDVTTTMLWVGHQVTSAGLIAHIIVPAIVSVIIPMLWIGRRLKGAIGGPGVLAEPEGLNLTGVEAALVPELAGDTATIDLPAEAAAIGKSLVELDLRKRTGVMVVSVGPEGAPLAAPVPARALSSGDRLVLSGAPGDLARAISFLVSGRSPEPERAWESTVVFIVGTGALVFVPIFKALTQLPPVIGMVLGLGVLWVVTELLHKRKNDEIKGQLSVAGALQRIDAPSILFFLGILLAVAALESNGDLHALARALDQNIGNVDLITLTIGLSSSIVDNVPLVAAAQGMYPLSHFPTDHHFWLFLAFCAGTGGSILIIGSAAGIAVMGIQRITFGWYVRHMSLPALLGYIGGAAAYLAIAYL